MSDAGDKIADAWSLGYDTGYSAGHDEGYETGYSKGEDDGYARGFTEGQEAARGGEL